jgi:hypothetical protein
MRWLGVWVLMTVHPISGGEEWGGPGREECEGKKFDPFFATRKFSDQMRTRFQNAMEPGGWLCIDEYMFSWLGRALKLPGWKIIKRKPHPIGLESKATACSVTGMLIDFEHQEGEKIMGHFECVGEYNKSTSWLLRLTSRWHNEEKRTVIADDVFATGWRCTGKMVVTHVHTGGCNTVGSDRKKRKYTQMNNGKVNEVIYHVKRPKVSAEHQGQMGAIDASHNYRRQSGKGTASLEKVCVANDTKDRIFINMIGWVLINVYLAKKHFEWGGVPKKTSAEVQEAIALALINNQWLEEGSNGTQMNERWRC